MGSNGTGTTGQVGDGGRGKGDDDKPPPSAPATASNPSGGITGADDHKDKGDDKDLLPKVLIKVHVDSMYTLVRLVISIWTDSLHKVLVESMWTSCTLLVRLVFILFQFRLIYCPKSL
jgi:hypothetical protein